MQFLKLAARNVARHRRRSLLALAVVALGVAALVFAWAVLDGQNAQMVRNMTETFTGHAQLQRTGFIDGPSFDLAFASQQAAVLAHDPEVAAAAPRVSGTALLSAGANTRGVLLVGVDAVAEPRVTLLHRQVVEGRYFAAGQRGGMLLGRALARGLGVRLGDEVAVLAEGMHASIGAQRLRVQGIFDTGNSVVDGMQAFIALPDAFELFGTDGRITALAIRLKSLPDSRHAVEHLQARLPQGFSVQGWRSLLPSVRQAVEFHEGMAHLVMTILLAIVTIGVAGVLQMSVAERLREFGTQMALGTSPWQLVRTIVYEGLLLAGAGFAIGYGIAAAAVMKLARDGIALKQHAAALQAMQGIGERIHPYLDPSRIGVLAAAMSVVALLATIVPAARAACLTPLAALRGAWGAGRVRRSGPGLRQGEGRWPTMALALRNLLRAPWRSSLGAAALAFGLGAFIFVAAVAQGFLAQMVDNTTGYVTGDVQIQHPQFRFDMRPAWTFRANPEWLARVRALPQVQAASLRLQGNASVSTPHAAEAVTLVGIDAAQELLVSRLHLALREGRSLGGPREVLIGRKLAQRLDARVGEKIVAMVQDAGGNLASDAFIVAGILDTGAHGPDSAIAYVPLATAQRLFAAEGKVSGVTLRLHDRDQMEAALAQLRGVLPADGSLQALSWQTLVPEVAQTAGLLHHGVLLVLAIIFAMVAMIVMNTLLMSVLERGREFGTLMAIGADLRAILGLVGSEAGVLGTAGVAAGGVAGALLAWHYAGAGLALKAHGADALGVSDVVHPVLSAPLLAGAGALLWALVLVVSLVPARKIARLDPIAALRRV
ncbi:MAG TPA: ABC transporter permease [Albitalea sp.]|nr:ABC transporter permease [Albitalea sp.]